MKYRLAKIFVILTLLATLAIIAIIFSVVKFELTNKYILIYASLVLLTSVVSYIALTLASNMKPKEVIKVIYKEVERKDPEAEKKKKELQEAEKIKKYVSTVLENLTTKDDYQQICEKVLQNLAKAFDIVTGVVYLWNEKSQVYKMIGKYAYYRPFKDKKEEEKIGTYPLGSGLPGQVAKDRKILYIDNVPEGYIWVVSGLGRGSPKYLILLPVWDNNKTYAVIEFATFTPLPEPTMKILSEISKSLVKYMKSAVEKFSYEQKVDKKEG